MAPPFSRGAGDGRHQRLSGFSFRMEDIDTVNFCKPETGIDRFGCNKYPFSFKVFKTLSF
jgi:hypothetical protein